MYGSNILEIHNYSVMMCHHTIHAFDEQLVSILQTHCASSKTSRQSLMSLSFPLHCNFPQCFTSATISSNNIPRPLTTAAHRIYVSHQSQRQHDTSKHVFDFLHKLFHTADRHHPIADTQCAEHRQRDTVSSISRVIYRKRGDGKQVGVKAWK